MGDKHISSQFDAELNSISTHVLEMGGLVESQLHQAVYALIHMSLETAEQVLEAENRINQMEVNIDHEIISTIGRRQPTARDLRFLMAISRTTQNLERAGDEIARVARMVKSIIEGGTPRSLPVSDLATAGALAAAPVLDPADAAWALHVLLGKQGRRLITGRRLRQICLEGSGLPEWLFDDCHAQVGDSAETIALLGPLVGGA